MADKKDYICSVPFTSMEIHDRDRFLCCASWLKKYLPEESSPVDAWNSTEANDIRDSILDGSYKHCDSLQCPMLHQLETVGSVAKIKPLHHKNNIPSQLQSKLDDYKNGTLTPTIIQFSFDRTCNLACPSCRVELFTASKKRLQK